jgi:GNAT superfamily N-acetyltransferase
VSQPAAANYPHDLVEHLRLPDGTPVVIRPIAPMDRRRHWRFICSLSLQTRYHRLMSARCLLPGELRRMVEIDYRREMALVVLTRIGHEEQQLGVARFVREDEGSGAAEFAIVVADAWQRRGIGRRLLLSLRRAATAAGVTRMGGITLATNDAMLRLARRLGLEVSREPGDWTVKRLNWSQPWATPGPVSAAGETSATAAAQ